METPARQRSKTHKSPCYGASKKNFRRLWTGYRFKSLWVIVQGLGKLERFIVVEWNRIPESMLINLVKLMRRKPNINTNSLLLGTETPY